METTSTLPQLNLPPFRADVRRDADGIVRIYDNLRRKFVALTPEEWVRQHFVRFLIAEKGYPEGLMANEVALKLNGTSRRCDTVLFERQTIRPLAIVEYKAPSIEITQKVFDQIARYNLIMGARLLIVSNGLSHYCCLRTSPDPVDGDCLDDAQHPSADASSTPLCYAFLREIPAYPELLSLVN